MQAQKKTDTFLAGPSEERTSRVGIIPSSFAGGEDHFGGAKFAALAEPRPIDAELTGAQIRQMTRRAIELGGMRQGSLERVITRDEDVLLLAARGTDADVAGAVIDLLRERGRTPRITIASRDRFSFDGVEYVDLASADAMAMPAPGIYGRRDIAYKVAKALLHADRVVAIAPLRLAAGRPSIALDAYRDAVQAPPPAAGSADTVAIDLFSFHPADYAIAGGTRVFRDGKAIRHNLVIASVSPVAVDCVAAAALSMKPELLPLLRLAARRGFGEADLESVWMRGAEIEAVRPRLPAPAPARKTP